MLWTRHNNPILFCMSSVLLAFFHFKALQLRTRTLQIYWKLWPQIDNALDKCKFYTPQRDRCCWQLCSDFHEAPPQHFRCSFSPPQRLMWANTSPARVYFGFHHRDRWCDGVRSYRGNGAMLVAWEPRPGTIHIGALTCGDNSFVQIVNQWPIRVYRLTNLESYHLPKLLHLRRRAKPYRPQSILPVHKALFLIKFISLFRV